MFSHPLVGVDGHDGGRDAIALATSLLSPGGELTLAHVYSGDPRIYRNGGSGYEIAASKHALELLAGARDEAQVEARLRFREAASVGRGLHELAEREGSDLVVIGACRRGLVGRVLVGDDTSSALKGARCAMAVAPAGYCRTPAAIHKIGVAYDGSPESVAALEVGRELGHALGAQLSAFEAVPSLYSASLDLLIIGSRGYGPIGRLVHGSTCQPLLRTARCPLLVLARGATARLASSSATPQTGMVGSER